MRLSGFHLPIEHISASSITKAVVCPESWRRKYILHEKEVFGIDKFIGTIDHETSEKNYLWKLDLGRDMGEEMLLRTYDSVWAEQTVALYPNELDEIQPMKETGIKMAALYHEKIAPHVIPIAVEKEFSEKIPGVPVPLEGRLDLETQEVVREHKTASSKLSAPKAGWRMQGRIYGLVTHKPVIWEIVTRQKTPQVVTGDDTPGLRLERSNPDHTVLFIQSVVERLNDLYVRYGPNNPWPTDGVTHDWMCNFCQWGPRYKSDCIAWRTT